MKKILVIEDNAAMRKNIALILEMEGYQTYCAADGKEGLAKARSESPDLILCDVMMPELDGYGVVRELRKDPAFAVTPFIFLTAKSDRADVRTGMNHGADDYLTKPVIHPELMAAVRSRLDRAKAVEEVVDNAAVFAPDFENHEPLMKAYGLTAREAEVLSWIAQGKGNADIASLLDMSERTVKHHVGQCFQKMGVENRSSAALAAVELLSSKR